MDAWKMENTDSGHQLHTEFDNNSSEHRFFFVNY